MRSSRLDLLADCDGDAGHRQIATRPDGGAVDPGGMDQEIDRRAWAGMGVHDRARHRRIASWPASGSRMMPEKKPEAALLGLPGRTQMVGSRMPDAIEETPPE